MDTLSSQRHLFEIPHDTAYFNCSYNAPMLIESKLRLYEGVDMKLHPWTIQPGDFFDNAEIIRELSADIFGGDPDGYAVIPSASYGFSTAARALEPQIGPGNKILVTSEEFPSNVLPWRRTADETGAEIVTVQKAPGKPWAQSILEHMDASVKVVAVSTCHWTDGAYYDLKTIGKAARDVGAVLAVDATQSLGAMPIDMGEIQPDFLTASGYKWLLGPYGFSLLYVSKKMRDKRPLEESWLGRNNAENFSSLSDYSQTYMPGARRFDKGEKGAFTLLPGAVAALKQIKAWSTERISEKLSIINQTIAEHLENLGFELPDTSERCPHMFGARLPATYNGNLIAALAEKKIYISRRGNALRFSPHLHITDRDIDRLLDALQKLTS